MRKQFCRAGALAPVALAGLGFTFVGCGETTSFVPGAAYEPDAVLSFGTVSVLERRTLPVRVTSNGAAAYRIEGLELGSDAHWAVEMPEALTTGISPGTTATITVTFTPCPELWADDTTLLDDADPSACATAPLTTDLRIVDNSPAGERALVLDGVPGAPPRIELGCRPGGGDCGDAADGAPVCQGLTFVQGAADAPCRKTLEIRNQPVLDATAGDLKVERIEILLRDGDDPRGAQGPIHRGDTLGFRLLDAAGAPLALGPETPLLVPHGEGVMIQVEFSAKRRGTWIASGDDLGLRLYSSDPERPIASVGIVAVAEAPELACRTPGGRSSVRFADTVLMQTDTATVTCTNIGTESLTIEDMAVVRADAGGRTDEFALRTDAPGGAVANIALRPAENVQIYVDYTPRDNEQDAAILEIRSTAPNSPTEIAILGGSVPRIAVEPQLIEFAAGATEPKSVQIANVGSGELHVTEARIEAIAQSSLDDFQIAGCSESGPCALDIRLCPADQPGCMQAVTALELRYVNNDTSQTDQATLVLVSNDPINPEIRVTIDAADNPCFAPSPAVVVTSPSSPRVGEEVILSAEESDWGGPAGAPATPGDITWQFLFAPGGAPALMEDGVMARFTPERSGNHILGVEVCNSCGACSGVHQVQVIVQP